MTTIEGLSPDGSHPLQKAWVELGVPQCGFCQAGQVMTAAALLKKYPQSFRRARLISRWLAIFAAVAHMVESGKRSRRPREARDERQIASWYHGERFCAG